ncbi:MAG TPA: transketolase C-terminal domain-containing protein [Syntrophorhabdaceae bacterium]|nr:transketolase C-terminal domain-containing protein [Syntrophorhabdaceae bacterium]
MIEKEFSEIPVGTWEKLKEGEDIAIIACGSTVYPALAAADELERVGIKTGVINGRFIKPIDCTLLLETASHVKRILTVEENALFGGFGSAVMEALSNEELYIPVKSVGLPDRFITHGSQARLRNNLGIDSAGIVRAVKEWLKKE